MKFFNKEKKKEQLSPSGIFEFREAMDFLEMGFAWNKKLEDKIELLNYVLEVVREDLKYDLLSDVIYRKRSRDYNYRLFPNWSTENKKRLELNLMKTGKTRVTDLSCDCVITIPWKKESIFNLSASIGRDGFSYISSNHVSRYIKELDLVFATGGNHSIAAGVVHKKGKIISIIVTIEPYFKYMETDGANWIDIKTKKVIEEVHDFRIAILYEIARIKDKLING